MLARDRWERVRTLLEHVVDHPIDDRVRYLAEACRDDPDLRVEVESLLRAREAVGTFLEPTPASSSSIGHDAEQDRAPALESGTRVGAFEILSTLGAGGMGEVYCARDTRLDRRVAIKILRVDLARDRSCHERFEREALAISRLAHPHICVLYDVGRATVAGVERQYLVMELLDGETLAERVTRGALPLDRVVSCAIQIAEALAVTHARGIIHRDLKPANIMISGDDGVKVLDFGLAKLMEVDGSSRASAVADRGDVVMSEFGRIEGTAAYMSPEQATGGHVDVRSDIFSFGATLYEMATGTRAFAGRSSAEVVAALLQSPPKPPTQIVGSIPPALERLIMRCLQREPEQRYQSMIDVKNDLQGIDQACRTSGAARQTAVRRKIRRGLVAVVVAALAAMAWVYWRGSVLPPALRLLPVATLAGYEMMPTLSPDGNQVAFAWNGDQGGRNFDLYVSTIGSAGVRRITSDPAHDLNPSWSPDGRQIAFVRHRSADRAGRLYVISPNGEAEQNLSDFGVAVAADFIHTALGQISWSPDGRYIAAARAGSGPGESTGIYLVPTHGGEPRLLTHATAPASHRDPVFSPGGRRLAYFGCSNQWSVACDVMVVDLDGERRAAGEPRRLTSMAIDMSGLAWARGGKELVYGAGSAPYVHYLWRVTVDGNRPPERVEVAGDGSRRPATVASRDRVVFERRTLDADIYRFGPSAPVRPTIASTFADFNASFSPDGTHIVHASSRSGRMADIWVSGADGSGPQQLTGDMIGFHAAPRWSPNGRAIAFASRGSDGRCDIWTMDADGGHRRQITGGPGEKWYPSWSQDGAWIYFTKDEGAGPNIWRIPAAGGPDVQLTWTGGSTGFESTDGGSLVYKQGNSRTGSRLLIVPIRGGASAQLRECVYGFSVGRTGVLYYPCRRDAFAWSLTQVDPLELRLMDPATGRDRLIGTLTGVADRFWGPNPSPDGRQVLYAKLTNEVQDLMMIEHFR
jgi:Tol biopolymer transport system component